MPEVVLSFFPLSFCLQSLDNYKQTVEEYSQAAAKTEARIR